MKKINKLGLHEGDTLKEIESVTEKLTEEQALELVRKAK
tara:strand:+ start:4789 stop:4905 length:117 start_codon:yes stop_codon:yes gene_type:complete